MLTTPQEETLRLLFDRLRKLALDQNPLANDGISMPQLTLLDTIAESPGCGIQELALALNLTAPTVSVGVRRLEEAGLLHREDDPNDGRAVRIHLTERGQTLYQRALAFRRQKMRQVLAGLDAAERGQLLALLDRAVGAAEAAQNIVCQTQARED